MCTVAKRRWVRAKTPCSRRPFPGHRSPNSSKSCSTGATGVVNSRTGRRTAANLPSKVGSNSYSLGGHRLVLESTRDVTERKAWEARQKLLLGELTHRV